jgi:hypothetical protein
LVELKKYIKYKINTGWHYGDSEIFVISVDNKDMLLKIGIIPENNNDSNEYEYIEDCEAEIEILKILKKNFIDTNLTPCIIEILYSSKLNIEKFKPDDKLCLKLNTTITTTTDETLDEMFCKYNELLRAKIIKQQMTFLVLEICDKSLNSFLKNSDLSHIPIIKSFIFMIIYTIMIINKKYPTFHHADLHTQNILLIIDNYVPNPYNPDFLEFSIEGNAYKVPFYGYWIKIIDFGFSSIEEEKIINRHLSEKSFKYNRIKNDILWLFHDLYNDTYNTVISSYIKEILDTLDPKLRYLKISPEYVNANSDDLQIEYKNMLENPIFEEYNLNFSNKNIIKCYQGGSFL